MNSPENDVGLFVAAPPFPPSFNNTPVVAEESEALARLTRQEDSMDEEFKTHCLRPSDVSPLCIPTWEESMLSSDLR